MAVTRSHAVITVTSHVRDAIIDAAFGGAAVKASPEVSNIIQMVNSIKKPGEKLIGLSMDEPKLKETFLAQTTQLNYNPERTTGMMFIVIDGVFIQQVGVKGVVSDQEVAEYMSVIPQIPGVLAPVSATPIGLLMGLIDNLMMPLGTRFPVIVMNICPTYSGKFAGVNEFYSSTTSMVYCVDMTQPDYKLSEAQGISHMYSHIARGFPMFPPMNLIKGNKANSGNLNKLFDRVDISQYVTSNLSHIVDLVKPVNELNLVRLNFSETCLVNGLYAIQFFPTRRATDPNGIEGDGIGILFNSVTMRIEIFSMWMINNTLNAKLKKCFQRTNGRKLDFYTTFTFDNFSMSVVDPVTECVVFETVLDLDTYNSRDFIKNMSMEQTILITAVYNESLPISSNITNMMYYGARLMEVKNCFNCDESLERYQVGASELPHAQISTTNLEMFEENTIMKTTIYNRNSVAASISIPKAADALNTYNSLIVTTINNWFDGGCPGNSEDVARILANKLREPTEMTPEIIDKITYNSAMIQTKNVLSEVSVGSKIEIHVGSRDMLSALFVGCSFEVESANSQNSITGHNGAVIHPIHTDRNGKLYMVLMCTVVPEMASMVLGGFECDNRAKMTTYLHIGENKYRLMVYNNSHDLIRANCVYDVDVTEMITSTTIKGYGKTMYIGSLVGMNSVMHYKLVNPTKIENVCVINDRKSPNMTTVSQTPNPKTGSGAATRLSPRNIYSPMYTK